MKNFVLALVVILAYVIQTTIIQSLNIVGIYPNLMLVVICSISFLFGSSIGAFIGFAMGLLLDIYYGRMIGVYSLLGMYLGIILGQFNKRFFKDNYIVFFGVVLFFTFLFELLTYTLGIILYGGYMNFLSFILKTLIMMVLNLLASFVIYPILLKMNLKFEIDRNIFR